MLQAQAVHATQHAVVCMQCISKLLDSTWAAVFAQLTQVKDHLIDNRAYRTIIDDEMPVELSTIAWLA